MRSMAASHVVNEGRVGEAWSRSHTKASAASKVGRRPAGNSETKPATSAEAADNEADEEAEDEMQQVVSSTSVPGSSNRARNEVPSNAVLSPMGLTFTVLAAHRLARSAVEAVRTPDGFMDSALLKRRGKYSSKPAAVRSPGSGTSKPSAVATACSGTASRATRTAAPALRARAPRARRAFSFGEVDISVAVALEATAAEDFRASKKCWPEVRPCLMTKGRPARASTAFKAAMAREVAWPPLGSAARSSSSQGFLSSCSLGFLVPSMQTHAAPQQPGGSTATLPGGYAEASRGQPANKSRGGRPTTRP
mmetsp:Transcript_142546/g.355297  ORF Transcript_142546/g.355297 Transcript_142546/m.355297 type:complete len:308 (-) Transcript_142546:490-1413(-)